MCRQIPSLLPGRGLDFSRWASTWLIAEIPEEIGLRCSAAWLQAETVFCLRRLLILRDRFAGSAVVIVLGRWRSGFRWSG